MGAWTIGIRMYVVNCKITTLLSMYVFILPEMMMGMCCSRYEQIEIVDLPKCSSCSKMIVGDRFVGSDLCRDPWNIMLFCVNCACKIAVEKILPPPRVAESLRDFNDIVRNLRASNGLVGLKKWFLLMKYDWRRKRIEKLVSTPRLGRYFRRGTILLAKALELYTEDSAIRFGRINYELDILMSDIERNRREFDEEQQYPSDSAYLNLNFVF